MYNFEKLVVFAAGLGEFFNPSNEMIKFQSLKNLLSAIKLTFEALYAAETATETAISEGELVFEGKEIKEISSSQMSFDSRIDSFDKLDKLLESIPEYAPNEPDLTITALKNMHDLLSEKNTGVINAHAALCNARINSDAILYHDSSGIVDVSLGVKYYIKSEFGSSSPQYEEISNLEFVKRK